VRGAWSLAFGVVALLGACSFDWDFFDPRASTGAGAQAGQGQGASSASSSATSSATAGGAGSSACNGECPAGTCSATLSETFAAPPPNWQFNGAAHHDASGTAVLTDATVTLAGTVFYKNPIVTDSFTASFEARISESPMGAGGGFYGPGDGMAFAFQTNGPTALGESGGGLAVAGLDGFGFELDTYPNPRDPCGDPSFEHAAVIQLTACGMDVIPTTLQASGALAMPLAETDWHLVEIELQAGVARMRLDAAEVLSGVSLPGFTPGTAYFFGFGAGTGGAVNRHEVRNLTIQFPTPRCL
jgi:hypothetical protein